MAKKKDDIEYVDGPAIAARILNHMTSSNKDKILQRITSLDPDLANRIEKNLVTFDDILDLTAQSVQKLVQSVDHDDLVLSLKLCSEEVREVLYTNMSQHKRMQTKEDFDALPPTQIGHVEEAQRRILDKLEELREKGLVRSKPKNDMYV